MQSAVRRRKEGKSCIQQWDKKPAVRDIMNCMGITMHTFSFPSKPFMARTQLHTPEVIGNGQMWCMVSAACRKWDKKGLTVKDRHRSFHQMHNNNIQYLRWKPLVAGGIVALVLLVQKQEILLRSYKICKGRRIGQQNIWLWLGRLPFPLSSQSCVPCLTSYLQPSSSFTEVQQCKLIIWLHCD